MRWALMFSLICAWINGWVNIRKVDDVGRHPAYYDVTVMAQRQFHEKELVYLFISDKWIYRWSGGGGGGGALLNQCLPFHYFPSFAESSKYWLPVEYQINIWQVSPLLSCGGICHIWMWFNEFNMYFGKILLMEKFANEALVISHSLMGLRNSIE